MWQAASGPACVRPFKYIYIWSTLANFAFSAFGCSPSQHSVLSTATYTVGRCAYLRWFPSLVPACFCLPDQLSRLFATHSVQRGRGGTADIRYSLNIARRPHTKHTNKSRHATVQSVLPDTLPSGAELPHTDNRAPVHSTFHNFPTDFHAVSCASVVWLLATFPLRSSPRGGILRRALWGSC